MNYLEYTDYISLGGLLPESDFTRQEFAARKEIDCHTFNRLQGIDPVPDDLKMCVLELIQRGYCGPLDGKVFTSVGNDGRSVSLESNEGKAAELIRKYLDGLTVDGVPVFYAGNLGGSYGA
jgi:hypothetical protein